MTEHLCYGVRSRCADGNHAILVDIDEGKKEEIKLKVAQVMQSHNLSDFFFVKNVDKEESYHLYCPTKVSTLEYAQILEDIGADPNFSIPLYKWKIATTILRFYSVSKGHLALIERMDSTEPNKRQQSFAHLHFLHVRYGVDISRYKHHDGSNMLLVDTYITQKD